MTVASARGAVEKFAGHPEVFARLYRRLSDVPLLPLRELPRTVVSSDLKQAFMDAGLADSDFRLVSLAQLIAFALRCASHYWCGSAVKWLLDGFAIEENMREAGYD